MNKKIKITKECLNCGKEFVKNNGKQFCCSQECHTQYYYNNKVKPFRNKPSMTQDQEMTIRKQIINQVYKKLIIQQNE